jgi:hypothetical protein
MQIINRAYQRSITAQDILSISYFPDRQVIRELQKFELPPINGSGILTFSVLIVGNEWGHMVVHDEIEIYIARDGIKHDVGKMKFDEFRSREYRGMLLKRLHKATIPQREHAAVGTNKVVHLASFRK